MPSKRDKGSENGKAKRWQFRIRNLMLIITCVCIAFAFHREHLLRQQAVDRLDRVLSESRIWIWNPAPLELYDVRIEHFGVAGVVFVSESARDQLEPRVHIQLLRGDGSPVASELKAAVRMVGPGEYEFHANFRLRDDEGFTLGINCVRVDCFDGDILIATGSTAIEAVTD